LLLIREFGYEAFDRCSLLLLGLHVVVAVLLEIVVLVVRQDGPAVSGGFIRGLDLRKTDLTILHYVFQLVDHDAFSNFPTAGEVMINGLRLGLTEFLCPHFRPFSNVHATMGCIHLALPCCDHLCTEDLGLPLITRTRGTPKFRHSPSLAWFFFHHISNSVGGSLPICLVKRSAGQ
jgi:hypothetical protein